MKNYKNYICLFLLLLGMSVSQEVLGQVFTLVSNPASTLANGDEIIFVQQATTTLPSTWVAMEQYSTEKTNKFDGEDVTVSEDHKVTLSSGSKVTIWKVKKVGDNFAFHNGSGFLQASSSNKSNSGIEVSETAYSSTPSGLEVWVISSSYGDNISVYNNARASDNSRDLRYYPAQGSFGVYTQYKFIEIYKKDPTVMFYQGVGGNEYVTATAGAVLPTSAKAVPGWDFIQYWSTDKNWAGDWNQYSKYTYANGTATASGYVYYAVYQGNVTGCNKGDISCKPQAIYSLSLNNPSSGSGVNWVVADVGCGPAGTTVTLTYTINVPGTSYQGATITRDDNGQAVSFTHDAEEQTVIFTLPTSNVTAEISFDCPDLTSKTVTINDIVPYYDGGVWKANVTWDAVSGATQYGIQVNDITGGSTFLPATYQTGTSYLLTGLTEGHTYRAGVQANNPCAEDNHTPVATKDFTPACPTLTGILAISTDAVGQTSAAISWGGVTTTAIPTASGSSSVISYDVSITVEGGAAGGVYSATGTTDTEWSSNSLTTNKTYTVTVRAYNVCGDYQNASTTFKTYNYIDYQFTCADLAWSTPDGTDPIWVTSTSGQVVRSQKKLHLTGSGLKPGAISFTIGGVAANELTETSVFAIRNKDYTAVTANGSGEIDQDVYVFYKPTVTSDGLDLNAVGTEITATSGSGKVESREYRAMSATLANVAINGRHLPSTFVIAAKWGKAWYALPANMTETATEGSNPTPVLIAVDDADAPTMAYCDNTNAYNLVPIGGTGTDRFKADGDKVYLGMVNNSNYALFASGHSSSGSENTNIGKSSGQTTSGSGLGVNYQWNLVQTATSVSSTADVVYNLAIANDNTNSPLKISRGEGKWGMYSAGISAIRLLPFTEISDLALTIEEWGTSEIAVKYTGNGTIEKVMVDEHEVASPVLSTIGGDIQRISGLTLDESKNLTNYPMSQFVIQITENSVLKQKIVHIPFIVTTSDATTIALREMTGEGSQTAMNEVIKTIDVVVRDGGTLTVNTAEGKATPCTFKNLYIYPGGKVDVSGNTLNVQNVYLRGGFSWLGSPEFGLPRMRVASDKSITGIGTAGHGVYYDLYLNSDIYYMTALPKDVALSDIRNEEGTTDFKAWIKYYNGGNRAGVNTDKPWVSVTSGSLKRGVGYEIAIKKRNGRPYGILRFPLLKATTWSNETECNPDVTAWGMTAGEPNEGVTANNAGWNLVGNPFMTAFHNSEYDNIVNYGFTKHGNPWDGTYDWDKSGDEENIKYFTIPEYTYEDWRDVRSKGATLEAFYPFAVQVKQDGRLAFAPANRDLKPSILRQKMAEREVMVDFELKDANGTTDVAGLTICNDYSAAFDSEDKEKTIKSNSYLKVYTMVGEYRTAFNSLPEADAAQPIPVGYIAPIAGNYTFALLEDGDYSTLEHLWLTDYETSKTVDLLTENYTFETAAGETNTRFALNAILKAEGVTTEIGDIEGADVMNMSVYGGNKHLVVRGLPSGADVWVYDAAGKLVATWTNVSDASVQTDVPASGVYSVRAIHNNTAVTKRAIVK